MVQIRDLQRSADLSCLKVTYVDKHIQKIFKYEKRLRQPDCKFCKFGGQTDSQPQRACREELSQDHTKPSKLKQKQGSPRKVCKVKTELAPD